MLGSARMRTPLLGTAKVLAVLRNTDRGVLVAGCRMMPLDSENVLWVGDAGLAAWQSSVLCRAAALFKTNLRSQRCRPSTSKRAT